MWSKLAEWNSDTCIVYAQADALQYTHEMGFFPSLSCSVQVDCDWFKRFFSSIEKMRGGNIIVYISIHFTPPFNTAWNARFRDRWKTRSSSNIAEHSSSFNKKIWRKKRWLHSLLNKYQLHTYRFSIFFTHPTTPSSTKFYKQNSSKWDERPLKTNGVPWVLHL